MAAFIINDKEARTAWHYVVDVDADLVIAQVYRVGRFAYDISSPCSDMMSVLNAHLSPEFWDWLPDQG